MIKNITEKYTSDNGYTGILYGKSSYAVYDSNGHEVLHTGFRSFNTRKELIESIEEFPRFREMLKRIVEDDEREDCDI